MAEQNWRLAKARAALNEVFIDNESSAQEIIASFETLMGDCEMYIERCERKMAEAEAEAEETEDEERDDG